MNIKNIWSSISEVVNICLKTTKNFTIEDMWEVNHHILLMKLEHYGIRDSALLWFESYLSKRKQFVCINGENSELRELSCRVPQGSVLGPLSTSMIYLTYLTNWIYSCLPMIQIYTM